MQSRARYTPDFLETANNWIACGGEVLVVLRYLRAAGAKDYALVTSFTDFVNIIDSCPIGTDIVVFRERKLPLRGVVSPEFIQDAQKVISQDGKYLYVGVIPEKEGCHILVGGVGQGHSELVKDLNDELGNRVAIGHCPSFSQPDDELMVSASKGGIDGPR